LGLLFLTTEQLPSAECRVTLADGTTELGLSRTRIHYRLDETEAEVKKRLAPTCRAIYEAMGYRGKLKAGLALAAHPMGTCRMGAAPEHGVVDPNLGAFGVGNLSICGTCVYPTGAAVNPTLTLVALAHRLGDHLARS
jgi:choline dehydrogenase-like flavoprotein